MDYFGSSLQLYILKIAKLIFYIISVLFLSKNCSFTTEGYLSTLQTNSALKKIGILLAT